MARLGIPGALRLAQWLHLAMFVALVAFGFVASLGAIYFSGMPLVAAALFYEHRSAAQLDLAELIARFSRATPSSARSFSRASFSRCRRFALPSTLCRVGLELRDPGGVATALEIGREPDAHNLKRHLFRDHAFA